MLLILLLVMGDSPLASTLRQEDSLHDRSTLTYQPISLAEQRPDSIQSDQVIPKGFQFGSWKLGCAPRRTIPIGWHAQTRAFWIDLDGDGQFAEKEKLTLGTKPKEIPMVIDRRARTLLIRVRDQVPLTAVRGFVEGQVSLEGQIHRAYLIDGGADGCFNKVGIDRLWLDLNRDGKIDPLFEIFPVGAGFDIGGKKYLLKSSPAGDSLEVFRRPTAMGNLALTLTSQGRARPENLVLNMASEWGEWVQIKDIAKMANIPVGRYRIIDLEFQLEEGPKASWLYHFVARNLPFDLEIRAGERKNYELLPQLRLQFHLEAFGSSRGGTVRPWVDATNGLTMDSCSRGSPPEFGNQNDKSLYRWHGEKAVIRLNEPGQPRFDEHCTGFT